MVTTGKLNKKSLSPRGEKILAAAQQLFLTHGYDETSLEMIISEAGGSRRSIYNEFGNKQGLLFAVIHRQIDLQIDIIASIDHALPPVEALKDVCFRFVKGMVSSPSVELFRLVIQVVPKIPEIGEIIYEKGPLKGGKPLLDYLVHLKNKGVLTIDDPFYSTQMLITMAQGRLHLNALLLGNEQVSEHEIREQTNKAVDLFIKAHLA